MPTSPEKSTREKAYEELKELLGREPREAEMDDFMDVIYDEMKGQP